MSTVIDIFHDKIKKLGYSVTATRTAVFEALLNQEPLTMAQIVASLHGTADRASVYRTIDLFEKTGIVIRLQMGWKYKIELSDDFHDHHHHMICKKCGKLVSIDGDTHIEEDLRKLADKYKFIMTNHQLEVQGICKDCIL